MSSSSSTVLRSKEKLAETKANPGRWYLQCIGGCGFLGWVDPKGNPEAIAENEKENDKDEDAVTVEELDSYVYFEDQDSEVLRPYLEQQIENEMTFEDPTKDYDTEVLEHACDYSYWDEEDDWYHNPYEGELGSDSDWSCLDDCNGK
ncbi:hypothetical protein Hanom_Chr00s000551g01649431 [Helianthus anomalus]